MEFGTTTYMARQTKKLVNEQGTLTFLNTQKCRFSQETIWGSCAVLEESEEVDSVMPGKMAIKQS